jgi:amino acid adenylation domain-containing protein
MIASPSPFGIHRLFELQARRTPRAVAVRFGTRQLTYEELDRRADELAAYLIAQGVGPEVLVGIYIGRSPEMLVALLGVLKAGGAYVPLDPNFPEDRIAWMLEDSGTPAILTQSWLAPGLPRHRARVTCLDTDAAAIAAGGRGAQSRDASPEELAYVIYTSGSTGRPKGVQIPHSAVVNFLHSMRERPGLTDRDILLAVTTLSFDIAVLELFLPLVSGATVVVLSREVASDGIQLAEQIIRTGVTVLQATPATWTLLLGSGWKGRKGLKIFCGGEALPRPLADRLLGICGSLWNMYGPTETTIWSTLQRVEPGDGPVPIGFPIAETRVYVVDAELRPVAPGESGELYIGGAGLARGYRNRPGLTAERFVPDPFSPEPGARMYRTGDLARALPDGGLVCLGRVDHQVKIRGFRIEIGEVETALGRHPDVREAVVAVREGASDDKQMVGYVVPRAGQTPDAGALREFLKASLPDYMVPSTIVTLGSLPLTPNGKVDRLALPTPTGPRPGSGCGPAAPRDRIETRLVQIWERVLGVHPVGIRDNIFDLGVHSLTAARLFAEIEKAFGKRLPPSPLFQAPTIERLADLLRGQGRAGRWSSLVAIQPDGAKPPLFCVHGGAGTVLLFHDLARRLGPDQPIYGLQMRGLYGKDAPQTRVEDMATHYLKEMRTLQPHGPYLIGGYCFGGIIAFEMAQQLRALGEETAALVIFNGPSPPYIRKKQGRIVELDREKRATGSAGRGAPPSLAIRVRNAIAWRARTARRWIDLEGRRCRLCLRLGLPLPESLRDAFFRVNNNQAELAYAPRAYPGRMILFRAMGLYEDPLLGWGELVQGGIEDHEVPGDHDDQRTLMKEPSVRPVARLLHASLERIASDRQASSEAGRPLPSPVLN